jgi:hypothetical protein
VLSQFSQSMHRPLLAVLVKEISMMLNEFNIDTTQLLEVPSESTYLSLLTPSVTVVYFFPRCQSYSWQILLSIVLFLLFEAAVIVPIVIINAFIIRFGEMKDNKSSFSIFK